MQNHRKHLEVVGTAGAANRLHVWVRDRRDGETFRRNFKANVMGWYKPDGGGGFHARHEARYEAAKHVAISYLEEELNHEVHSKEDWQWVKNETAAAILDDADGYSVRRPEEESVYDIDGIENEAFARVLRTIITEARSENWGNVVANIDRLKEPARSGVGGGGGEA